MSETKSHDPSRQIYLASLLLMGSMLLSRIIGLLREWALAKTVGATAMTDVYYASFTIPDFVNYLMAAGALSISFIPIVSDLLSQGKKELAERTFRFVSTLMGAVLIVLIVAGEIFAGELSQWIAPGFNQEQQGTLVLLIRIILPAQFFFYWGGLATAIQHAHGRFLLPAIAPITYNLGIIFFGVVFHSTLGVTGFSIGVLVGSVVSHGGIQWFGLKKLGYSSVPLLDFSPELVAKLSRYFHLTLPIMLGFSIVVTDEWLARYFASYGQARAISWLAYARMEMRIPVAIIGQAAGIASFPYLSRLWSENQHELYGKTLLREVQKLWAIAPLAAIIAFDHALPITHFIFGGGKFQADDFANTASALQMFSYGILFWTLQTLLSRGFYACQKTWLPSLLGTAVCIFSIPLYWHLSVRYGFLGLALAGSIAVGVYCIGLFVALRVHLIRHCPGISLKHFYLFCGLWLVVLGLAKGVSQLVLRMGFYSLGRSYALLDVVLASALVFLLALGSIRLVFKRLTDGKALF